MSKNAVGLKAQIRKSRIAFYSFYVRTLGIDKCIDFSLVTFTHLFNLNFSPIYFHIDLQIWFKRAILHAIFLGYISYKQFLCHLLYVLSQCMHILYKFFF